jgi:diguanylate cyclase (GGDEF)-like protein/PAS domain S-box-containing protein
MTDAHGAITYLSRDVSHLFQSGTTFSFAGYMQSVHPDDRPQVVEIFTRATIAREEFQVDYRVIGNDGSLHWVTGSGAPRFSADGEFNGFTGALLDVSDRYEAIVRLEKSEAMHRLLTENSSDLISHHAAESGIYLFASPSFKRILGYDPLELVGKLSAYDFVQPEDRELINNEIARQMHSGSDSEVVEFRTRHKEGHYVWVASNLKVLRNSASGEKLGAVAVTRDISARRRAEQALRSSEQRLRDMLEMTPAGYLLANGQGEILEVNPALCRVSGYLKEELLGQQLERLFAADPWDGVAFTQDGPTSAHGLEAIIRHKQGKDVHVLFNGSIRRASDGQAQSLTAFITDITLRKQIEHRLEHLASHDTLTGLPNRALLHERLQQMLTLSPRDASIAVLFIDLDRFKEVNDSFGHQPGDVLLCEVGRRLREALRPGDVVARLGGDEFMVVAHCSAGRSSAASIAEKLLRMLTAPIDIGQQEVFISASIGISMFPEHGDARDALFQSADTAMYQAKAAGRNSYRFFDPEMGVAARTRMTLELSLRRALGGDEFEVYYQPRIDLKTMSIVGMEALLRWNHPELGQVPPMQFIPLAEERNLISPIGHWVLRQACKDTVSLMRKLGRPLRVSVNLSARQLRSSSLPDEVRAVLDETGFPPQLLELELTESALVEDIEHSAQLLRQLKNLGVKLAVDDFGTGYSGLAYLRRFALDVLKLDRSFVLQRDGHASHFDFVKAFVDMAHALKLSVVAEGVETREVLQFLCSTACDEAQGYFIARPMPLDALVGYLSSASFLPRQDALTFG